MDNNFKKSDSLGELEKKLYSPNEDFEQKERKNLRPQEFNVAHDWKSDHVKKELPINNGVPKTNWFLGIFILAFIFFVGALGYVGIRYYLGSEISAQDVDILVNAPLTISAGEVLDFEVVLQNKNQAQIKYVDVEIQFPNGTRSVSDIDTSYNNSKETIDSIAVGEIVKRNYEALFFGEENEKKEISIFLKYQIEGSTLLFKKEKKFDMVIKSTPVRLTVTNVKTTTSGQDLDFTIELVSNSTQILKNVMVQGDYPFGFTYKSSSITPENDNKTWIIPILAPKETLTFNLKGKIEGQNRDERFFKFLVGLKDEANQSSPIVFSTKGTVVSIERPFIEVNFAIGNNNSDILLLDPETALNARVSFKNNTESALRNASIVLNLDDTGVISEESIKVSNGFYQSLNNTVTWDYTTFDKLASIPVGSSGEVDISFRALGVGSQKNILNPQANFTINMQGNRNQEGEVAEIIDNSIVKKLKFNTQLSMSSFNEYYSNILPNTGPIPPKIEQKTTYTGSIVLKNSSNSISNAIVTMKIPLYVQFDGAFSPSRENVSYDSVTRLITWNVGNIDQNIGYAGNAPKKLSLQVSIVPSVSQISTTPELITGIKFTGKDNFTGKEINQNTNSITTEIRDQKYSTDSSVMR